MISQLHINFIRYFMIYEIRNFSLFTHILCSFYQHHHLTVRHGVGRRNDCCCPFDPVKSILIIQILKTLYELMPEQRYRKLPRKRIKNNEYLEGSRRALTNSRVIKLIYLSCQYVGRCTNPIRSGAPNWPLLIPSTLDIHIYILDNITS